MAKLEGVKIRQEEKPSRSHNRTERDGNEMTKPQARLRQ